MSTRHPSYTPSLFDTPPAAGLQPLPLQEPVREPDREDRDTIRLAREFVRWCCSFGPNFRNSPDVTNLRYWSHKNRLKLDGREEAEILVTARPLFLKRIEQLVRKSGA
jgi:hypothetical protein